MTYDIRKPGDIKIMNAAVKAFNATHDKDVSYFAFVMLNYAEIDIFNGFEICSYNNLIEITLGEEKVMVIKCIKEAEVSKEIIKEFTKYIKVHKFKNGIIITSDQSYYFTGITIAYIKATFDNITQYRDILNVFLDLRLFEH